jgi:hypothetical protein
MGDMTVTTQAVSSLVRPSTEHPGKATAYVSVLDRHLARDLKPIFGEGEFNELEQVYVCADTRGGNCVKLEYQQTLDGYDQYVGEVPEQKEYPIKLSTNLGDFFVVEPTPDDIADG